MGLFTNDALDAEGNVLGTTMYFGDSLANTPDVVGMITPDSASVAPDTSMRIWDKITGAVSTSLEVAANAALQYEAARLQSAVSKQQPAPTGITGLLQKILGTGNQNKPLLTVGTSVQITPQQWSLLFGLVGLVVVGLLGFGFIKR